MEGLICFFEDEFLGFRDKGEKWLYAVFMVTGLWLLAVNVFKVFQVICEAIEEETIVISMFCFCVISGAKASHFTSV